MLLWRPFADDVMASATVTDKERVPVLRRLCGHEGVIFSIAFNIEGR